MRRFAPILMLDVFCLGWLAWSLAGTADVAVWAFEIAVGVVGVLVLNLTYGRFRFSNLVYVLVGIHFAVLAVGARYTYAEMPLFNWLKELGLARNYYDRVGHFMQGFVPALIVREILLRRTALRPGGILAFLCVCVCLALSAGWEFLEWGFATTFYPGDVSGWLGFQGDMWDAHWDMLMATIGATLAVALLSRAHDRGLNSLPEN